MTTDSSLGAQTAQILLDTDSVLFRPDQPFFFSSGWASPVYVDCKRLISYPLAREAIIDLSVRKILSMVGYEALDVIAGGEGGGMPFAAIIADRLHLPLVVARRQSKGIGRYAQMDGTFKEGSRVLLVDDLTTDGRTKASFCNGLKRAGADVRHTFVIFKYGIFDHQVPDMDEMGINLFSLATWTEVLAVARERKAFDEKTLAGIEAYIADPIVWSERHGGISREDFTSAS